MKKGRAGTMTHDYKRNGTSTLFAALNVFTVIIGECKPRHRHQEFLSFLKSVERQVPEGLELHLIVDRAGNCQIKSRLLQFIILVFSLSFVPIVGATGRIAFVVGNSEYEEINSQPNPKNDSEYGHGMQFDGEPHLLPTDLLDDPDLDSAK